MQIKVCGKCKKEKNIEDFNLTDQNKNSGWCRKCRSEYEKQYRDKNSEKIKIRAKNYNATHKFEKRSFNESNKERQREQKFQKQYGISIQKYNEMLSQQNAVCYICGLEETAIDNKYKTRKALSVDHNHTTGEVRRLLCHKCNLALGGFGESIERLQKAINYLQEYEKRVQL